MNHFFVILVTKKSSPRYTLGFRNTLERLSNTPGNNDVVHFFHGLKCLFFGIVGPGAYATPESSIDRNKAFSFGVKVEKKQRSDTPAPNQYQSIEKYKLENQKAFSFGLRPERKLRSDAPPPNQYSPEKCNLEHHAAYSFGTRTEQKIRSDTPGMMKF